LECDSRNAVEFLRRKLLNSIFPPSFPRVAKRKHDRHIRLWGVRQNNLKGFDLDLPLGELIVVTGLSGSGKSSLAFDTLYAEGQRRYIETFSPYARQFFDRMDKPRVDRIDGIPPAIAIEQRNAVRTTRSTVGTMTEVCDFMKVLWPHLSRLHCRQCGVEVGKDTPQSLWETLRKDRAEETCLVTFTLPLSKKLSFAESMKLIAKQGYQRVWLDGEAVRIEDVDRQRKKQVAITVIQDRVKASPANKARFVEACEQAYHFGKGRLDLRFDEATMPASRHFHCARCDLDFREPTPALFSFNHPLGACPDCKGFGRVISIDDNLALPDKTLSLADGAVKPWRSGTGAESQRDLKKFCSKLGISMTTPFKELPPEQQRWVIDGDENYGVDAEHEWPRAWYGVKGYFRWLESKSYKMHVRVLLSRYRAYSACPTCHGKRLQPESLQFHLPGESRLSLADFYDLPLEEAEVVTRKIAEGLGGRRKTDPIRIALNEVAARLGYLNEVGLGYLNLNRPMRSLSGGETERVSLTACLGTRLVNTLYVLDEPSVGLHPRDTKRLVGVTRALRDLGNTVLLVEHEEEVMRAADRIVDLGPGHGESGGELVFNGTYKEILRSKESLTGRYLSGAVKIEPPERRNCTNAPKLRLSGARKNNLRNLEVEIPLGRFVCVTGVSGSGKSTLVRDELFPALRERLGGEVESAKASDRMDDDEELPAGAEAQLTGWECLRRAVMVDQSSLGKTPRSNPAVYIGAFEDIREFFAKSEAAKEAGMNASTFSFNSQRGQCERCRGAGYEKIEMQFLSDVFVRCAACDGRRYQGHVLEVRVTEREWSIVDFLEATVDEVVELLSAQAGSRPAAKAVAKLALLREVGLGYLRLGQPINTLSGGECQRLKLVSHLAAVAGKAASDEAILFLFDEPTTGLHFEDVRVLLAALQRLVDSGHSVIVIEHHLDVIKCADWVVDLGPEAGRSGGDIVVAGPPEAVAQCRGSHTGQYLKPLLQKRRKKRASA
jgi:excinuclease ABC subunit A